MAAAASGRRDRPARSRPREARRAPARWLGVTTRRGLGRAAAPAPRPRPRGRPHRLERVPLLRRLGDHVLERVGDGLRGARRVAAGSSSATSMGSSHSAVVAPVLAARRQTTGTMTAPVLAASTAGPAGSVVHSPKSRTGRSVGPVAPVDDQAEDAGWRRTRKTSRRLRHGMIVDAPPRDAGPVEQLEELGIRRIVGQAVGRDAAQRVGAGEDLDAADVAAHGDDGRGPRRGSADPERDEAHR